LDLSDNLLQDKGAKYLCEYFMNSQTLEQLIVGNNGLTEVGALRLTDMFRVCSKLKVVGVAGNEQIQSISQACEKRGRRNNQGLQEVVYL
jgi:Ran GTPase-activating protein (RanGAP) involved in mRNA processing and transport